MIEEPQEPPSSDAVASTKFILFVEDDSDIAEVLKQAILMETPCHVEVVAG